MQEALTDAEKGKLLAELGMTQHVDAFATPSPVAEAASDWFQSTPESEQLLTQERENVADAEADTLAAELLKKAKGNLDTAKQLAINWAQAEFDKVKLSKIQAAALGVDKTAHNKAEYARIQRERERINSAMRKQTRGHVAQKIAASKKVGDGPWQPASSAEVDAFLLQNQGNPVIAELLKLQNGGN